MKKCPSCNSTRITKHNVEGKYVISCAKCGYVNMREINTIGINRCQPTTI